MFEAKAEAEAKALRPRPKFWPRLNISDSEHTVHFEVHFARVSNSNDVSLFLQVNVQFYEFDQSEFFNGSKPAMSSMDDVGYVYVPSRCKSDVNST